MTGAKARLLGFPRVHHRTTDSTNERAKALAAAGAPHGTLVTAGEQTAGRGRQGRRWESPPGRALLASVLLRGLEDRHELLPLAAAVAVCEACEAVAAVDCRIKWPNDVWIAGRKVAGILIEGRPQERWAVVGVGVNVTTRADELPAGLRSAATSLTMAASDDPAPAVDSLLEALLDRLGARLDDSAERVLRAWRGRDALAGATLSWEGGRGIGAGVDDRGYLLVDTDEGRVTLGAGEVHLELSGGRAVRGPEG